MALTKKRQIFVDEYLVDLNARQAAVRAGYSRNYAEKKSYKLLVNQLVSREISARMAERETRVQVQVSQDRVLREMGRLAFNDPRLAFDVNGALLPMRAWPDDLAAAVAVVKVKEIKGEDGLVVGEIKEIRFWDKGKGLELAARHLGMLKDKLEVTTPVAELIRAARARIRLGDG